MTGYILYLFLISWCTFYGTPCILQKYFMNVLFIFLHPVLWLLGTQNSSSVFFEIQRKRGKWKIRFSTNTIASNCWCKIVFVTWLLLLKHSYMYMPRKSQLGENNIVYFKFKMSIIFKTQNMHFDFVLQVTVDFVPLDYNVNSHQKKLNLHTYIN